MYLVPITAVQRRRMLQLIEQHGADELALEQLRDILEAAEAIDQAEADTRLARAADFEARLDWAFVAELCRRSGWSEVDVLIELMHAESPRLWQPRVDPG